MGKKSFKENINFYLIDCTTTTGKIIDITILTINAIVCLLFILDSYYPNQKELFLKIESIAVSIFIIEFILRLYASNNKPKHLYQPYTIIDVLAIVPTLISWLFPMVTIASLSALRVFRLFRVFRFLRFMETGDFFFGNVAEHILKIMRLATSLAIIFFVSSGFFMTIEQNLNSSVNTFGDALYFTVVTLTTVGFGDITPVTEAGKWVTIIMILSGIIIIPWQAGQIISSFMRINSKTKSICPKCGLRFHDKDASHCKHCGNIIYQEVDG